MSQDVTWNTPCPEDGYSKADLYIFKNAPEMVPVISINPFNEGLVSCFWELRSFINDPFDVLNMEDIERWQRHAGIKLGKWERVCMFSMDRAFRRSRADVLKFHASRSKNKNGSKGNN